MAPAGILKQRLNPVFLALMVAALMFIWSDRQLTASQSLQVIVTGFTPKDWEIFDEVKQFVPENIYEQINGRASFFLAYDMIKMTYASFVNGVNPAQFIDLSIYNMGTTTNAFGVFSSERSPEAPPLNIGRTAYRSGANYFIWKGQYYIRLISSDATDELRRIAMDLVRKVTESLPDSDEQPWGLAALPLKDRISSSIQYVKANAMGMDFLHDTYMAQYRKSGTKVSAFLSRRDSAEAARGVVDQYATFAKKYGKGVDRLRVEGVDLLLCDMRGSYDAVFHKGRLIGGVSAVDDRDLAVRAAIELWQQLHLE